MDPVLKIMDLSLSPRREPLLAGHRLQLKTFRIRSSLCASSSFPRRCGATSSTVFPVPLPDRYSEHSVIGRLRRPDPVNKPEVLPEAADLLHSELERGVLDEVHEKVREGLQHAKVEQPGQNLGVDAAVVVVAHGVEKQSDHVRNPADREYY